MTAGEEAGVAADWPAAIHQELRALHESLARLEACTRGLADAVNRQNGRVGKLEDSSRERELAEQFARGAAEQRAQAVLTRGQLTLMVSLMGAVGAAAGVVARFL